MAKRARANGWMASSAGTSTRWTAPPTSPTDSRSSAFRWDWNTAPPALKPEDDGTLVAAVIYDPMRDELFTAERGRGATLNGKPVRVSRIGHLAESLLATGFPSRKRHASPNIHFYQEFTLRSHGVRRAGSAALDLAYVACGRMDGFWEFNLNPWDTAAGILLVEEAGGRVTDFAGRDFRLDSEEVLASNGLIHEELIGLFQRYVRRTQSLAHPHARGVCPRPRRRIGRKEHKAASVREEPDL